MKLFVFIVGFLSFSSAMFASADENPTLKRVLELYKRKDFKEINKIASEYIRSQEELSQDDKVIKVYFHTENDLQKLDTVLDQIYKNTDELSPKFHTLTYMLMEKTLLAEQYDIGVKWGDIYRKEAKSKKTKYIKGLYLYSCLLYKANKSTISLSVIDNALKEKPNKKITGKLKLLRIAQLKNDFQVIVESKNYLKNNYESTYADFIFAHMVQAYRNTGKKKRVEQLKEDFKKDFGDSILVDTVMGI
jgi:hypothetical protein